MLNTSFIVDISGYIPVIRACLPNNQRAEMLIEDYLEGIINAMENKTTAMASVVNFLQLMRTKYVERLKQSIPENDLEIITQQFLQLSISIDHHLDLLEGYLLGHLQYRYTDRTGDEFIVLTRRK